MLQKPETKKKPKYQRKGTAQFGLNAILEDRVLEQETLLDANGAARKI